MGVIAISCSSSKESSFHSKEVYHSSKLEIVQLSPHAFQHISYLQTNDFGNVPCNGLVVESNGEVIVFDSPTTDSSATELINWVSNVLKCKVKAIIPTHFHEDCTGGLEAFHAQNIPSYANKQTIELAKLRKEPVPQFPFIDSLTLNVGTITVNAKYCGPGHTIDNVVGYMPSEKVLFGGCLVKELNATKGYLGDANVGEWSNTIRKVKIAYPDVRIVVPGHGKAGNKKLLDYTERLFEQR